MTEGEKCLKILSWNSWLLTHSGVISWLYFMIIIPHMKSFLSRGTLNKPTDWTTVILVYRPVKWNSSSSIRSVQGPVRAVCSLMGTVGGYQTSAEVTQDASSVVLSCFQSGKTKQLLNFENRLSVSSLLIMKSESLLCIPNNNELGIHVTLGVTWEAPSSQLLGVK